MIGFEETQYTVDESAGVVRLAVAVFGGEEVFTSGGMDSVQIRLNTQTGSAIGITTYYHHHRHCHHHHRAQHKSDYNTHIITVDTYCTISTTTLEPLVSCIGANKELHLLFFTGQNLFLCHRFRRLWVDHPGFGLWCIFHEAVGRDPNTERRRDRGH